MRISLLALMAAIIAPAGSMPSLAEPGQQSAPSKAAPAPKRDLSGVWQYQGSGGAEGIAPEKDMPPMTAWAKARFDLEKPGYGSRAIPGGNDPILQCDPIGFPRIMVMPLPLEFVQVPGRVLEFWEREHEWRAIWTDGRPLPTDPDPSWFGYAIGHWDGDYTLMTESAGFNDKTWLGPYDVTVTDPMAYTKAIVGPRRFFKLHAGEEIEELPCVWSEENSFTKRIREPAAAKPAR
jgi:hypothetical protein